MKNPPPSQSALLARSMRRDVMVGTAVLLLVETGLGGIAAASTSLATDPDESGTDLAADAPAGRHKPVRTTSPVPDTHVDTAGNTHPLSMNWEDEIRPLADVAPLESQSRHPPRHLLDPDLSISGADLDTQAWYAAGPRLGGGSGQQWHHGSSMPVGAGASPANELPELPTLPPFERADMHVLIGTDGNDVMRGGDGNDYIFGREGADLLAGANGADRLLGGKGDDVLSGGAGSDMLVGEAGNDLLTGGAGADTFLFRTGFGHDTVTDFRAGGEHDVIAVARSDFADFAALSSHLSDTALGALLTLHDGSTLTLSDVGKASLTAHDFYFGV